MSDREIKVGVVGLDGHGPVFTNKVNGQNPKVEGLRVVAAMPVPSVMISENKLKENIEEVKALGVEIVKKPEDLVSKVDGILILHDDGAIHCELVKLFAEERKPIFVDKPLESNLIKAKELVEICKKNNCPVFTTSSLRFSLEIQKVLNNNSDGRIVSAMTYSPYDEKSTMPGWIYYGIHGVEPLFSLMGSGCKSVSCIYSEYGPVAIGTWEDGRMGIVKGICKGKGYQGFGFCVWREKTVETITVDTEYIYPELLKNIKTFIETGVTPVPIEESLEVIAFMEAANESMRNDYTNKVLIK